MHTCPFCGYECDCDLDDTSELSIPDDCPHVCDDQDDWDEFIPEDERLEEGGEE